MSENGLEVYGRESANRNIEKMLECVKILLKKGVLVRYDIILDNPYETLADNIKTLRLVSRFPKPYQMNLFHLVLHEGTKLRIKAIHDGLIDEKKSYDFNDLKDNYINALFRLVKGASGLCPSAVITLLTSPLILNNLWLQKPIKVLVDTAIVILRRLSSEKVIRIFHRLISGKYSWAWFIRHRRNRGRSALL